MQKKKRAKTISFREAEKILNNNGYILDKIKGSHYQYIKDGKRIVITLQLNKMIWRRLCKENKLITD